MALTKRDIQAINQLIQFANDQLEKRLNEKISHLPTKDEFYTKMDEVMGELKAIREEQTAFAHRQSNHEDRIDALEKIHPNGRHPTALQP